MTSDIHEAIAASRDLVQQAAGQLALLLLTACPLPHEFVPHRDRKLPWCETCGYDSSGERVKQMGA